MTESTARRPPNDGLRIATYNVHRCIGTDGRHDPHRVAEVLRELDADVVSLQEVTKRAGGPRDLDQLQILAAATDLQPVEGPTLQIERGHAGNAILSRLEILDVRRFDLTVQPHEPRGAIDVDLLHGGERIRVITTHLGLRQFERRKQLASLGEIVARDPDATTIVLGDLNAWWRPGEVARALGSGFAAPRTPTFPSWWPLLPLDRVLVRPEHALLDLRAHVSPGSYVASDHLPVEAIVRPPDPTSCAHGDEQHANPTERTS